MIQVPRMVGFVPDPGIPPIFQTSWESLIPLLRDLALVHIDEKDTKTSKASKQAIYSIKEGYQLLLRKLPAIGTSKLWKDILNNDGIPKVKAFCWHWSMKVFLQLKT